MTLWMLHLPLDTQALARYSADRGWMHAHGYDEGQALHHLLVESFGKRDHVGEAGQKGAFQPFRLLPSRGRASLYGYSAVPPEALIDTARTVAPPEALALLDLARIQSKPMPTSWREGQVLGFDLRTLPVVRLSSAIPRSIDHRGRARTGWQAGAEVDAFLARVLRHAPEGDPAHKGVQRDDCYLDWLTERLAPAADLLRSETRLVRHQRIRVSRSTLREFPEAVFHGSLRITDPDAFLRLLSRGVGRHCAYGFGMLLLRPPGRMVVG